MQVIVLTTALILCALVNSQRINQHRENHLQTQRAKCRPRKNLAAPKNCQSLEVRCLQRNQSLNLCLCIHLKSWIDYVTENVVDCLSLRLYKISILQLRQEEGEDYVKSVRPGVRLSFDTHYNGDVTKRNKEVILKCKFAKSHLEVRIKLCKRVFKAGVVSGNRIEGRSGDCFKIKRCTHCPSLAWQFVIL